MKRNSLNLLSRALACALLFNLPWTRGIAVAQSLPPVHPNAVVSPQPPPPNPGVLATETAPAPVASGRPSWLFPLAGKSEQDVQSFYHVGSWIAPISQLKFLYGIDQENNSKSLSADLVTMVFPNGVNVALGSSVAAGGTPAGTNTGSGTGGVPGSTSITPATVTQQDSGSQAIDRLMAGGDFYVRGAYPIIAKQTKNTMATVFAVPKLGFSFSGFGSEQTVTEATEYNINTSGEGYAEYRAFGNAGLVFGDVRSGWQYVQPAFA